MLVPVPSGVSSAALDTVPGACPQPPLSGGGAPELQQQGNRLASFACHRKRPRFLRGPRQGRARQRPRLKWGQAPDNIDRGSNGDRHPTTSRSKLIEPLLRRLHICVSPRWTGAANWGQACSRGPTRTGTWQPPSVRCAERSACPHHPPGRVRACPQRGLQRRPRHRPWCLSPTASLRRRSAGATAAGKPSGQLCVPQKAASLLAGLGTDIVGGIRRGWTKDGGWGGSAVVDDAYGQP